MSKQSVKQIIKNNLLSLLEGTKSYAITRPFYSGIGHILLFHRVCPKNEIKRISLCPGLDVTPEYLENVIKFFAKHNYVFISLDQLFNTLRRGKIDNKFVLITFDDGYVDNFIYAYPIFKKYNIPFAIYITTNFLEGKAILWWCLLEELIVEKSCITFELEDKIFKFDCRSIQEKESTLCKIHSIIRDSHEKNYLYKIKKIFEPYKIDIYKKTKELTLNWKQIEQLGAEPLATIGAHTVNHYVLSKLSTASCRYEILSSKRILESHLNREVKHFSYPFGACGEVGIREFEIVKEYRFKTATTTRAANIFFAHKNHLESLPRINMGEELNVQRLKFLTSGLTHCLKNRFKKVVTV